MSFQKTFSMFAGLALALAFAFPARAQNLLADGDFDHGFPSASWITQDGNWNEEGYDATGCERSVSAVGSATDGYAGGFFDECLVVDPTTTPTLYLGGLWQCACDVYAVLRLQLYSDPGCATQVGWSAAVLEQGPRYEWAPLSGGVAIPENVEGVKLWVEFESTPFGSPILIGVWDHLYVGRGARIFVDDFEHGEGGSCRWSDRGGE